ncbi:prepilin peptidase [Myxococcota bacterium]|nr:prepilin peptidase [Myxococcota bacterium]
MLWGWGLGCAVALGLVVGSFLNVVIHRVPEDRSVVRPGSACPRCQAPIAARDNVPVLGWLLLGGHCRSCGEGIPARYPAVELLTGLVAAAVWVRVVPRVDLVHVAPILGPPALGADPGVVALPVMPTGFDVASFLVYFGFFAALIAVSFIDLDHGIIPNVISLPGIVVGIAAIALLNVLGPAEISVAESAIGAFAGGFLLFAIAWIGAFVFRRDAMGMGDVKLLAMIGAFLGAWPTLLLTLLVSSLLGSLVGIAGGITAGRIFGRELRYGPFLALGAAAQFFFGPEIMAAWMGALGRGT